MHKLYLDANILYGFFKNIMTARREMHKPIVPSVIKFFKEKDFIIYASILTKCEIARRMKLEHDVSELDFEKMWHALEEYLRLKIITEVNIDQDIVDMVKRYKFRSRMNNIIHLYICKKLDRLRLTFVTGDKRILEDGKKFYEYIIDYNRLRELKP